MGADESRTTPSGLRAGVDPSTDEGRDFMQQRVALFAKLLFFVSLAFYAIANVPLDPLLGRPFDWREEWFGGEECMNLGIIFFTGVAWAFAVKRPRSPRTIMWLDALVLIVPCGLLAAMIDDVVRVQGQTNQAYAVLLACTNAVVARAIVIPSSMRRTLVISLIAFAAPLAVTPHALFATGLVTLREGVYMTIGAAIYASMAITAAAVASRILFDLRGEVRRVQRLGQYLLEHKIGEGGMGVVYLARHAMLRRPTAVKLLSPGRTSDSDLRRFEREVRLTAKLTHPNTVAVYDYGRTPHGVFYYAMEFLDGITLEQLVADDGPQPPARVAHILSQACGALSEAHKAGLIHRDVKPANIMLCERGGVPDVVKVLDFGLVKRLETDDGHVTASTTDAVQGTPHYLSPEAIENPKSVEGRSDLYALGAVGYYLLTGKPVFEARNLVTICSKHLTDKPMPPSERLGKPVPEPLENAILSCLAKSPDDRPEDAAALGAVLAAADHGNGWSDAIAHEWWKAFRERSATTGMRAAELENRTIDVDVAERIKSTGSGKPQPAGKRGLSRRPAAPPA